MRESAVERKLVFGVKQLGGLCMKFVSPGTAGVPDRIIIMPGGSVLFVELKTEKGKLSAVQKNSITALMRKGASVFVLYGAEEVKSFLKMLKLSYLTGGDED